MSSMPSYNPATDRVTVWQCIGCGKIDMPQPCIGVCQDRKAELVYANVYDQLAAYAEHVSHRNEVIEAFIKQLVYIKPHEGEWERTYQALQKQARDMLQSLTETGVKNVTESASHSKQGGA